MGALNAGVYEAGARVPAPCFDVKVSIPLEKSTSLPAQHGPQKASRPGMHEVRVCFAFHQKM